MTKWKVSEASSERHLIEPAEVKAFVWGSGHGAVGGGGAETAAAAAPAAPAAPLLLWPLGFAIETATVCTLPTERQLHMV